MKITLRTITKRHANGRIIEDAREVELEDVPAREFSAALREFICVVKENCEPSLPSPFPE